MIAATPAPKVVHKKFLVVPYVYALILTVLVVWQLVMFERFAPYVANYLGQGAQASAAVVSMALIGLELFALPFLLRMSLSPLARFFSASFAFVVPLAWAAVVMAGDSFNIAYLVLSIGFFSWASVSFWVLGGPQVIRLRRH